MNGKDMLEWMNGLDDKAVIDADVTPVRVKKRNGWKIGISVAAGVLAVALLTYIIYPYIKGKKNGKPDISQTTDFPQNSDTSISDTSTAIETQILKVFEMAAPVYPASRNIQQNCEKMDAYAKYCTEITRKVLSDGVGENKIFSPLSLYMSLSMAAEISDGNTRQQILDVMHQPDIKAARNTAKSIWLANYMNNGEDKLLLANSLWLNSGWTFEQSLLDILASDYFASSFSGDPTDADYSSAYREWLSEQTDGLLDDNLDGAQLDPAMLITLASSVNFSGSWESSFGYGEEGIFHGTSGDVTTCFYNSLGRVRTYTGENFISAVVKLKGNGSVRFILPEEGMTPEQLLQDEELFDFMNDAAPNWDPLKIVEKEPQHTDYPNHLDYPTYENLTEIEYPTLTMPLVDFTSSFYLNEYCRELGITDAFDPSCADFSPLTKQGKGQLSVDSINQDARIIIDEFGCKAVAITTWYIGTGDDPIFDNKIVLDRPYIIEVVSESGLPLFVGIVNNI